MTVNEELAYWKERLEEAGASIDALETAARIVLKSPEHFHGNVNDQFNCIIRLHDIQAQLETQRQLFNRLYTDASLKARFEADSASANLPSSYE